MFVQTRPADGQKLKQTQEREAGYLRALAEKEAEARELRTTMQELAAFHRCVLGRPAALVMLMVVCALTGAALTWSPIFGTFSPN